MKKTGPISVLDCPHGLLSLAPSYFGGSTSEENCCNILTAAFPILSSSIALTITVKSALSRVKGNARLVLVSSSMLPFWGIMSVASFVKEKIGWIDMVLVGFRVH